MNIIKLSQIAGGIAAFLGSLLHFFVQETGKYVFAVGAILLIALPVIDMIKNNRTDFREHRIQRMNVMVSLLLGLATWSMFDGSSLWVASILIYALVVLFLSFRG